MDSFELRKFVVDLSKKDNFTPDIDEIRIFIKEEKPRGFVIFHNYEHAKRVFSFFSKEVKKKSIHCKNSSGEFLEVILFV